MIFTDYITQFISPKYKLYLEMLKCDILLYTGCIISVSKASVELLEKAL